MARSPRTSNRAPTDLRPLSARVGRYGYEAIAVARRILLELGRRRRSLVFWALFPAAVLGLNGTILAERAQLELGEAFQQAAPVTLVGAALFFSCLGGSVATVVAERESHTLKRLFIAPLSGMSYFLGIFLAHGAIALGQTLVVYAIAGFLGAEFAGSWLLGAAILGLSTAAYVGMGFVLGAQFARRVEDVNALVAAFGVPLLILGGTFLPASLFPDSLLNLARFNPIFHMNEAFLQVAADGAEFAAIAEHFWVLLGVAIASVVAGWLAYQRMVRAERRL